MPHVVYVDSDPSDDAAASLRDAGMTVDVVETAADCLTTLRSADCVVTAGILPDATCVDLCSRIRTRRPDVPLVVFPAIGSEAFAGEVVAAGVDGYVPRSQGAETLATRVRELVGVDPGGDVDTDLGAGPDAGFDGDTAPDAAETDLTPPSDGDSRRDPATPSARDGSADRKRVTALEAFQETARELLRAGSTAEIADAVVAATEHVVERPLATVRFYDEDAAALEPAAATAELDDLTDDLASLDASASICWDAYTDAEPTVVTAGATTDGSSVLEHASGTVVVHPLGEHGLLSVGSSIAAELDSVDVHLVHVLAATAEAALDRAARDRELERAESIVETVGDGVYLLDRAGRFVTVNDTMIELTGYDHEDLVGEHVSTVLTDESADRRRKRIRALSSAASSAGERNAAIAAYEITLETRDGAHVPCEVNTTLTSPDGDLDGTVGIVRDVSDRKRMQRTLLAHEAKIESLHEVASRLDDCETRQAIYDLTVEAAEEVLNFDVCVVDIVEGDVLVKEALSSQLNAEYARTMSIDEGIAGKTYRTGRTYRVPDITADDDAAPESDQFRSVLSIPVGDHGVFQAVSTEPDAFDSDDEELAELLISHVVDALARLDFEDELRAERDRFAALFENVPDAVVSMRHPEGRTPIVEDVNPAFEGRFGYEADAVIGEPLDPFIVPRDVTDEAATINRLGADGEVVEREVRRRTADGLRDFMMRVVPLETDADVDRTVGLYTDVTDRKRQRKRLEILNRVLRHDLRNGMNIIDGCADVLAGAVDGAEAEYATIIRERTDELIGLAEKTRAVERTLERDESISRSVEAVAAVRRAIGRLEDADDDTVDATVDWSVPDQCYVHASEYFETAVFQVLENAIEHNDREPCIEVRLSADRGAEDGQVSLTIADNGPGIPAEERELLQEDREITQLRHASGLGLWLVNWVVTESGGQLAFRENEPRGTVVEITLPRADSGPIRSAADESAASD